MKENGTDTISDEKPFDINLQTTNPAFAPGEMIACERCGRSNPPTRPTCLYCGAALEISDAQAGFLKPNLRRLEDWEKGFNVIFGGAVENFDRSKIEEIAAALQIETDFLRQLIESKKPLPLARIAAQIEAENIGRRLADAGADVKIVGDEELSIETVPRRLRSIDFWDDKLVFVLFNNDEIFEISPEDLRLIVTGAIFERRVETIEARGKKGENKMLATAETASDEFLIDLYGADDRIGFRVEQDGFDFSWLGAEKTLLAAENIRVLVRKLAAIAPSAELVEDYSKIRPLLANVWQVAEKKDSRGMKRQSFGKFNLENVTTVGNAAQFTKYSRLQRHLL